jgi:uncharacterized membrane protein (DUF2068 family)
MAFARSRAAGFKAIGILKLTSGCFALLAGFGLVRLLAADPGSRLERFATHHGLDPHNHVIHALISTLTGVDPKQLRAIQAGTFFYAALHAIEGIGLVLGYEWAGFLVVIATGSLIPFEIYEVIKRLNVPRVCLLFVNGIILGYLIYALGRERRARHARATQRSEP